MSRSRLPPPPARGGGRPLPPEPTAGESEEAPPPLPSRPGHGGKPGGSMRPPPPPVVNGQSQSSDDDDEGLTYEEPDLTPDPPVSRHHQPPPPPPSDVEQETYDDLEDVQPEPVDEPVETYDDFDVKPVPQQQQQQQQEFEEDLYEEEPASQDYPTSEQYDEEDGQLYEFMPENDEPPPPPPVTHARPHIPLPPEPNSAPNLPARPPPSRTEREPGQDAVPDLPPGRPSPSQPSAKLSNIKKISGDGPLMLGISQEAIGLKRANLKKVVSEDLKEPDPVPKEPASNIEDANSVKARINMFKQAEKGVKPSVANKPLLPVKPQMTSKPEVKSPPAFVKLPPQPQPVKQTPPPPPQAYEESDDIYDEGFSYVPDPLSKEEWYHGEIERAETNSRLQSVGQDGTFLVRKSKQGGDTQPYTLVVLYLGHVYNLKMRLRSDGQVALGEEKADELAFKDVQALINHHRSHDVILVNVKEKKQYKTMLKKHPINVAAN